MKIDSQRITAFVFVLFISLTGIMTTVSFIGKTIEVRKRAERASEDRMNILRAGQGKGDVLSLYDKADALPALVEEQFNKHLFIRESLVECYGMLQKLMGKRMIDTGTPYRYHMRLENGQHAFYELYTGSSRSEGMVARLKDTAAAYGSPFLFVLRPTKVRHGTLPYGLNDTAYACRRAFCHLLRQSATDVMDLADLMPRDDIAYGRKFFLTDHHWKLTTAFEMARHIAVRIGLDTSVYSSDRWFAERVDRGFYGSLAANAGTTFFEGPDTVFIPILKSDETFRVECYSYKFPTSIAEGRFRKAMIRDTFLTDSDRYAHRYAACLGGDNPLIRIVALENTCGKSLLVFGDSFSLPLIMYLAPACRRIDFVDLRSYAEDNIGEMMKCNRYDYVLCVYPDDLDGITYRFFGQDKDSGRPLSKK